MCVHLRAPHGRPAQLRVRPGKQRAQPGSWAGLCRHRVSDPASVSTMAGWPSSAVLLTPKEGKHESSRVGLSLPRPPWGDDRLSLGGVTRQSQSEVAGNAEASSFPGRNPSLCISQEKKKKQKKTGKQQEARLASCQVPPYQAPQSSCLWNHKPPEDRRIRL